MLSFITVPLIACQKPTFTWYSRSLPGSGRAAASARPPPPPKMLEKMSRNPPPLPALRPAAPAPSEKSLKSKPPKSKGTSCV